MDPLDYTYESPLQGYEGLEALGSEVSEDGKSLVNPAAKSQSKAYEEFIDPLKKDRRGGFDVHIYFFQANEGQTKFAKELHERIRREFPELRIYKVFERPLGPHPIGMFEVNLFTPQHFGAFIPWLVINRGPLSALIHPNTDDEYRDHTQRATWMGQPLPLHTAFLKRPSKESEAAPKINGQ